MKTPVRRMLMLFPWLEFGGADTFNLDLTQQLTSRYPWHVTIVTTLPGVHAWRSRFAAYTSSIIDLFSAYPPEQQPEALVRLIQAHQIDTLLISNSQFGYTLLPYLRLHCPHLAVLDYLHMEDRISGGFPKMAIEMSAWLDQTVVSSAYLRDWMLYRGSNPNQIAICTTNIDSQLWNPANYDRLAIRQAHGIATDQVALLYAARLVPQKRPDLLGRIAQRLANQQLPFTLLVAGDGPEYRWLEQFVRSKQLNQVRLLGACSSDQIRELMAATDIFVLPSQYEGISLALYEAMAMGLPSVVADVGGQRELLTPACGTLIPPGPAEEQQYYQALTQLIGSASLRQHQGQAARQRIVASYSLNTMGDHIVELVEHAHQHAADHQRYPTQAQAQAAREQTINDVLTTMRSRQLWGQDQVPGMRANPAILALRTIKLVFRPTFRWLLLRNERIGAIAVMIRDILTRILIRNPPEK